MDESELEQAFLDKCAEYGVVPSAEAMVVFVNDLEMARREAQE